MQARLKANPYKLGIPSLFLTNTRSLSNKIDELRLRITSHCLEYCVMIITETWLDSHTPDTAIELAGRIVYRVDRTIHSGKRRSGRLCIYINSSWFTDTRIIKTHCSLKTE